MPSRAPGKDPVPPELSTHQFRIAGPFGELEPSAIIDESGALPTVILEIPETAPDEAARGFAREYVVRIVDRPDIDPFFNSVTIRIAPHGLAPTPPDPAPPTAAASLSTPQIDYLNKDYESFRRLMLDTIARSDPEWAERNAADLGMTMVEALAYAADGLSYYQDAVGTERSLEQARLRVSVQRHLRLIGYRLSEGCNSRVWVAVSTADRVVLPAGTPFLSAQLYNVPPRIGLKTYEGLAPLVGHVFESLHDQTLHVEQNQMDLYTWGSQEYELPAGAVSASLRGHIPGLARGSVVIFQLQTADPLLSATHPVRLTSDGAYDVDELFGEPITRIRWNSEDAIPVALPVALITRVEPGVETPPTTVVIGNVVLADYGKRMAQLELPPVPATGEYRPVLRDQGITFAEVYRPRAMLGVPAQRSLTQQPTKALARVLLSSYETHPDLGTITWTVREDLFLSGKDSDDFVVEVQEDLTASLRFGDGECGRRPTPASRFQVQYRLGNGVAGNLSSNSINHVVSDSPLVLSAWNPLPASGGIDPQTVTQARIVAPKTLTRQHRCVTEEDYTNFVSELPEVQAVLVSREWTEGTALMRIYVQRANGEAEDPAFLSSIQGALEPRRIMGHRVLVQGPKYVPLAVSVLVHVSKKSEIGSVRDAVTLDFASFGDGFFAPVNFSFGTVLFASQIVERAMSRRGVKSAQVRTLEALGHGAAQSGSIRLPGAQIMRLDPNAKPLAIGALTLEFSLR